MLKQILLCLLILLLFSCKEEYLDNRFDIVSIYVDPLKSTDSSIFLGFEVKYFSDSVYSSYAVEGIQKGQDGSFQKMRLLNSTLDSSFNHSALIECGKGEFNCFSHLIKSFNDSKKCTLGERLERGVTIILNDSCELEDSVEIEILNRNKTIKDTIVLNWN